MTFTSKEFVGEERDEIIDMLDQTVKLGGFGFFTAEIAHPDGRVACSLTPVAPDGRMSHSFVLDRNMVNGLIGQLQAILPVVTYEFDVSDFTMLHVEDDDAPSIN